MRSRVPKLSRLEVVRALPGEFGQAVVVLPWWAELLGALDLPTIVMLIVLLPRQAGKTQAALHAAVSELFTRRDSYVVIVSASGGQAEVIVRRKLHGPLRSFLAAQGIAAGAVKFTRRGVEVPELGSSLEVVATNEATVPGRSPTLLVFEEAKDIPDGVFTALVPSVIGSGGKVVILSTAGRPTGFLYSLVEQAASSPEIWLYRSAENENPHADRHVLDFLRRKLGALFPAAMARELGNEFTDDGESFLPAQLVDSAVDDSLGELPESGLPAYAFLDLSRKRDLTSLVVVLRDGPRRPEARDHLVAASVQTWDPRQSPSGEVRFEEVRAALDALPRRFPRLESVRVDEGAEAGTILPWAREHPRLSVLTRGFVASPTSNMELWGALAARLHAGTLSIPRHDRLIAELKSLRQESFALGSKWRVVDASRKLHRDVSVALAGAVHAAALAAPSPVALSIIGGGAGLPLVSTTDDPEYAQFYREALARQLALRGLSEGRES